MTKIVASVFFCSDVVLKLDLCSCPASFGGDMFPLVWCMLYTSPIHFDEFLMCHM